MQAEVSHTTGCLVYVVLGRVQHVHCGLYATFSVAFTATFIVASESNNYQLTVGGFSGNANYDAFGPHDGTSFGTHDRDIGGYAVTYCGGFWFMSGLGAYVRINAADHWFDWYLLVGGDDLKYSQMWLECP